MLCSQAHRELQQSVPPPKVMHQEQRIPATWLHKIELEGADKVSFVFSYGSAIGSPALAGFKSYLGRTTLGPFAPFSCVIGPNGCGKSVVVSLDFLQCTLVIGQQRPPTPAR